MAKESKAVNRKARRAHRPAKPSAILIREDLAVELYSLVRLALGQFGVTIAQQERAIARSRHRSSAPKVSGPLLKDMRGLGRSSSSGRVKHRIWTRG